MKFSWGIFAMVIIMLAQLGIIIAAIRRRDWPQVVVYGGFMTGQGGLIWIAVQRNL